MENIIEIKDYCKKLKGSEVLKHINLTFTGGNVYGLKGKNGSGKTMLMRAICGLISPTSGSVVINGETLGKQISFPRSVGVLIENPAFIPGYTGLKNLEVLADIQKKIDRKKICETLEKIGLDPEDKRHSRIITNAYHTMNGVILIKKILSTMHVKARTTVANIPAYIKLMTKNTPIKTNGLLYNNS